MSNKKRKIKLGRRVVEMLDLPEESVSGQPKLTVQGRDNLLVENHEGIFECMENTVRLHSSCGILRITGEALTLMELSTERLYITGSIRSVEYES